MIDSMPRLLIVTATGSNDPTRASIPFHIAANGAVPEDTDCGVLLAGDATGLLKPGVAEGVHGVGIPPLGQLLEKCRAGGITFYV
jgi:predicted peroxiredoxin